MTFKEMRQECIALLGDEYSASQEEMESLDIRLGRCLNYAYERIAKTYYHPVKTETVTTDERCRISKSSLLEAFWYLRGVHINGKSVAASEEMQDIFVGNTPNSKAEVTYCYVPAYMTLDTDRPVIPKGEISAMAYIFSALSIFAVSEGRSDDAVLWNAQAEAALVGSGYRPKHPMGQRRWY